VLVGTKAYFEEEEAEVVVVVLVGRKAYFEEEEVEVVIGQNETDLHFVKNLSWMILSGYQWMIL
jgi:hypothetical protein